MAPQFVITKHLSVVSIVMLVEIVDTVDMAIGHLIRRWAPLQDAALSHAVCNA